MGQSPTGTVTFLFTDVEGSTRAWSDHPDKMKGALARHDEILREAIESRGGYVFSTAGDAFSAAFARIGDAAAAAVQGQRDLAAEAWPAPLRMRVRMGLHTGEADERDGDYFGPAVNRAARVMSAGHGGQVLLSSVAATLLDDGANTLDLGLHRLKDLPDPEHLWQLVADGIEREFPPVRTANVARSNLPTPRNPLIGRDAELQRAMDMLADHRLLTVLGAGGAGKTRLAVEVAATMATTMSDGAFFADLSSVADEERVVSQLAAGVQVAVGEDERLEALAAGIGDQRMLLIVDNCEHVLDAAADAIDMLLSACPNLRFIATSREALDVEGEQVLPIGSLASNEAPDDPQALPPAVQLFVGRWRSAPPTLSVEDRATTAEICRRLDGLPLAIELAASRADVLPLSDLLGHLDERFTLLTGGRRRTRGRQQTLETTVAWSYDLLDRAEQAALRALSVPPGSMGFDLVAGMLDLPGMAAIDMVESLASRSLLVIEPGSGSRRYRLLETIRAFANDRLLETGEADEVRERHLRVTTGLIEATNGGFIGLFSADAMELSGDVMAALDWARSRDRIELATHLLVSGVHAFYEQGLPQVVEELLGLADDSDDPETQGWGAYSRAVLGVWKFDFALALAEAARVEALQASPEIVGGAIASRMIATSLVLPTDVLEAEIARGRTLVAGTDSQSSIGVIFDWCEASHAFARRRDEHALRILAPLDRRMVDVSINPAKANWHFHGFLGRSAELIDTVDSPVPPLDEPILRYQRPGGDMVLVSVHVSRAIALAGLGEVDQARREIATIQANRPLPRAKGVDEEVLVGLAVCCLHADEQDRAVQLIREGVTIARDLHTGAIAFRILADDAGWPDEELHDHGAVMYASWLGTWNDPHVHDKARRLIADELARLGLA